MTTLKDRERELDDLMRRVEHLEHFTIDMGTSQTLPLPDVTTTATTDEVRQAVIDILTVLRTLRIGA